MMKLISYYEDKYGITEINTRALQVNNYAKSHYYIKNRSKVDFVVGKGCGKIFIYLQ